MKIIELYTKEETKKLKMGLLVLGIILLLVGLMLFSNSEITPKEEGKYYYIDVEYTNGETEQLKFERPAKWENGSKKPDDDYGENGDYFFDTKHGKIYCKSGGIWAEAVDFNIEKYTVIFDLNDDVDTPASMPTSASIFKVERGSYFSADGNGDIPIPVRAGYEFGGWYAKKHVNELTMSPFTDFTPVFSDLTLYARWIPINN